MEVLIENYRGWDILFDTDKQADALIDTITGKSLVELKRELYPK